ncbi:MAG: hypothetical protein KDK91_01735 [Gammaproteobacteria bacterium]|nr:hypothetical protein [Gammaproteobacteria bacterium]
MTQHDNWGWRARIGMFIVASEAVPEAEWWAMAPEGVSVHAARVTARAPWANWNEDHTNVELAEDLARGCRQFASMRLEAVVIGHSSSSVVGGPGWDAAVVARMRELLPAETVVTTNGLDSIAALHASGVTRPFLVFPPWFGDDTLAAGLRYFDELALPAAGHLRHDPGLGWRDLPPGELYAQGLGFEQDVEALYREISRSCPDDADGIFIAGTGFRCVGIIEALEQDLRRPVITANQASLWHCLRLSGVRSSVSGYGRLWSL